MSKFLNIDLHVSVIADVIDIFKRVNKDIHVEDWSLSGHGWVFNKSAKKLDVLSQSTWRNLNSELIKKFTERYDSVLKTFDGFIVCHPVSFVLLFEKYDKPIYIINSCRYDMPFSWNGNHGMIKELHMCLSRLQDKKLLTFISNNKADNFYFNMGASHYNLPIETTIVPSLCLYTQMQWNQEKHNNRFLLYTGNIPNISGNIVHRHQIGRYTWNSLMQFNGIIHLPYEASTMSIFEHISSNIPLFFPSKTFLIQLWSNTTTGKQMNYWSHHGTPMPEYLQSTKFDKFWVENADYYDIEGYYYFDSFDHLNKMLSNFKDVLYDVRKEFTDKRKSEVLIAHKNNLLN